MLERGGSLHAILLVRYRISVSVPLKGSFEEGGSPLPIREKAYP